VKELLFIGIVIVAFIGAYHLGAYASNIRWERRYRAWRRLTKLVAENPQRENAQ
jgi:hypothetical protein